MKTRILIVTVIACLNLIESKLSFADARTKKTNSAFSTEAKSLKALRPKTSKLSIGEIETFLEDRQRLKKNVGHQVVPRGKVEDLMKSYSDEGVRNIFKFVKKMKDAKSVPEAEMKLEEAFHSELHDTPEKAHLRKEALENSHCGSPFDFKKQDTESSHFNCVFNFIPERNPTSREKVDAEKISIKEIVRPNSRTPIKKVSDPDAGERAI